MEGLVVHRTFGFAARAVFRATWERQEAAENAANGKMAADAVLTLSLLKLRDMGAFVPNATSPNPSSRKTASTANPSAT